MSALRGCTVIVLSGPGSRSRQVQIPRGWPLWMCLLSVLSLSASLFAGRQARAWFDPNVRPLGVPVPQAPQTIEPPPLAIAIAPKPRPARRKLRVAPQVLPSAIEHPIALAPAQTKKQLGKELRLFDVNAARALSVRPFDIQGLPDREAFGQLKEFMRCRRSGQTHDMNANLVALLAAIAERFDGATLHVISGHRVADDAATRPSSQHTRGTAADIRIAGVGVETLAAEAQALGAKGVGVYPVSRFVHVDVREQPYYWRDVGTGAVAMRAPF